MERQTKIRGQKYQGKGFSLSGFVFSPHQNSGYLKKIFQISEWGYFCPWSQAVMYNFTAMRIDEKMRNEVRRGHPGCKILHHRLTPYPEITPFCYPEYF